MALDALPVMWVLSLQYCTISLPISQPVKTVPGVGFTRYTSSGEIKPENRFHSENEMTRRKSHAVKLLLYMMEKHGAIFSAFHDNRVTNVNLEDGV